MEEQAKQLEDAKFGLAIGTPHRLQALCDNTALSFARTQLVILDAQANSKQYTVCTLPDTAPQCMALLQNFVLVQMKQRKDIQVAFV
jgi:hypothetical protein